MIRNLDVEDLLGRLTDNIKGLESKYQNFSDKCAGKIESNAFLHELIGDKYEETTRCITFLKQYFVSGENIKSLMRKSTGNFSETHWETINSLKTRETSSGVEVKFDNLLEMVICARKLSLQYERSLENQIFALKSRDFNPKKDQTTQANGYCGECEKVREDSKSIVGKMNELVGKINLQVREMHFPEADDLSGKTTAVDWPANTKIINELKQEIRTLKEKIREYAEEKVKNMISNAKFQGETHTNISKIQKLEEMLHEKKKEVERLDKIIENYAVEKANQTDSICSLQKDFQVKLQKKEAKICKLENEKKSQFQVICEKANENGLVESEFQELFTSYSLVKDALIRANSELRNSEERFSKLEKCLKEMEKFKIIVSEKENELESLKDSFKKQSKGLTEMEKVNKNLKESYELIVKSLKENAKKLEEQFTVHENFKNERQERLKRLSIENINLKDAFFSSSQSKNPLNIETFSLIVNESQEAHEEIIKENHDLRAKNEDLTTQTALLKKKIEEM